MKTTALLAALAATLALAGTAAPAAALTKNQAYWKARQCLLKSGAGFVSRRGDGGGYATFTRSRGSTFWTYKTFLGQVESVTIYFAGVPGPSPTLKRAAERCVTLGI